MKEQSYFKDKTIVGSPVLHFIALSVCLFIFWLLLSGRLELKFIIYGIVTAVVCSYVCMPLLHVENLAGTKKYFVFKMSLPKLIVYIGWLIWQLILANIDVMQACLRPQMKIEPKVILFRMNMDNPMATTFLANSITLTPGTVTINVSKQGVFAIHALTPGAADGIVGGDMARKVAALFGEKDVEFEYLGEEDAQ